MVIMFTCNYVIISAVQVFVNLWQTTFYIPEGDHTKAGCGTGFAMILYAQHTSQSQYNIAAGTQRVEKERAQSI